MKLMNGLTFDMICQSATEQGREIAVLWLHIAPALPQVGRIVAFPFRVGASDNESGEPGPFWVGAGDNSRGSLVWPGSTPLEWVISR